RRHGTHPRAELGFRATGRRLCRRRRIHVPPRGVTPSLRRRARFARDAGGDEIMAIERLTGSFGDTVTLLREVAQRYGDVEAFVAGPRRITFGELDRSAAGLAAAFADFGVGRGDVVALLLPSSIDYAVCYHATMRLGAITSGINPRLGPNEVAHILGATQP